MRDGIRAFLIAAMSAITCMTCFGSGTTSKPDGSTGPCSSCGGVGSV
jgi:DnaJ-class molecular chaperone